MRMESYNKLKYLNILAQSLGQSNIKNGWMWMQFEGELDHSNDVS